MKRKIARIELHQRPRVRRRSWGRRSGRAHGGDGKKCGREKSGKKKLVYMRWACSTFQRQTMVEFALASVRFSTWARAFYDLHMPEDPNADKPTYTVVRKLAFKWLRIIYRCWQTRTPYDEARYLESLRRAGSPIWQHLQKNNVLAPAPL